MLGRSSSAGPRAGAARVAGNAGPGSGRSAGHASHACRVYTLGKSMDLLLGSDFSSSLAN